MIKVGLTGGMGSGKTTVAKVFEVLGIPVYYADLEAKKLLNQSTEIKRLLIAEFGSALYKSEELDRALLANLIFENKSALEKVNAIVHPEVAAHFLAWCENQKSAYVLQEAAILFETGGYKRFEKTILVTAPKDLRIERIMKRDGLTREQILSRMNNQWEDEKKIPLADFVIFNDDEKMLLPQIKGIHENILRFANSRS